MEQKRLVIIDGYSLLFRAFYGTRFLSTSDGRPTNALFGFVNTLIQLFGELKPTAVVVALDPKGKTFRHTQFAEYKGTRRDTPQELISQLETSREMIKALNIPALEVDGFEADDIVGTISFRAENQGYQTIIVTGDRDNLQLVDENVTVMMPGIRGAEATFYDPPLVNEKYGFEPKQLIDYKALAGDSSDNIPGVPGIGDKTATLLVQRFGSVEVLENKLEEVEEKYRKKLEPNLEQMRLCKWLATIKRDVEVEYDFKPFHIDIEHLNQIRLMVENLEFKSQAKRLENMLQPYMTDGAKEVIEFGSEAIAATHLGEAGFTLLKSWLSGANEYSIVIESSESQPSMFESQEATSVAYIAQGHEVRTAMFEDALRIFKWRPDAAVGHDLKRLYKGQSEKILVAPKFDTALAGYVLQSNRSDYNMDDLIGGYLESRPRNGEQRAVGLLHLKRAMESKLEAENQTAVYRDIELALIPVLAEMEDFGIQVNREYLQDFSKNLNISIEQSACLVHEMAGQTFNIGSPKQLGEILFEKLGIPGGKKTKTGWSTGAEILTEIDHPIAQEVVNYRELTKLKNTYADALPKMIGGDGRIHTTFNQTVAATGRLSSIEPNLQNIPIRTELGRQIRKAFEAQDGFELASFDYSQIELRVLAHMSQDPNLVTAFEKRVDVHTVTAALMFKVSEGEVTKEQRRLAKLLNYAVLYGVTDFGLANQLGEGFSRSDAESLIQDYNDRFPAVKEFTQSVIDEARAKGFTSTMCGRRRHFPDIHSANRGMRQYAERQAMNAPIQGTAADMIKLAMIKVRKDLGDRPVRMLLQVHDELVFEVPNSSADQELYQLLKGDMEQALPLSVPVEVDGKMGRNWLDMTPLP